MKPKKKYSSLSFGKLTSRFIILTFLALTIYMCINLIPSTSVFSVKVDMFINMQNVRGSLANLSSKNCTGNNNENDTLATFPVYENERELGEQRLYHNMNESDGSTRSIHSDENRKPVHYFNFDRYKMNMSIKRYNDSKRKKTHQDENIADTVPSLREFDNAVYNLNGKHNSSTGGDAERAVDAKRAIDAERKKTEKSQIHIDIFGNIPNGSDNTRQIICDKCFQHNFNYVIENDICKLHSSNEEIELLILITTTHKNIKARNALRATWLSLTKRNTASTRYAFLLGESNDQRHRQVILRENNSFHDIIKEDFVDSYMNLTYKTIMGFKWAATKCAHAHFVMKTDDDMYVNIPNVLEIIRSPLGETLQHALAGSCTSRANPIRNKKSKWFASFESYPQQTYPGFCSGTGYVTSMNVVTKIYQLSPNVPFFHLEDVYVALCLRKLGFILKRVLGFNPGRPKLDPCIYKGNRLVTAHQMTPLMLQWIWKRQCVRFRVY